MAFANQLDVQCTFSAKDKAKSLNAPSTAATLGQTLVLKGAVQDQSPAQSGTLCTSPQSMSDWMNYLHAQAPIPNNATGVPVSIDAVDPNGNPIHVADVVSDKSGTYRLIVSTRQSSKIYRHSNICRRRLI